MILPFVDTGVAFSTVAESFWEPHLKSSEVAATQYQVGMVFSLMGISYLVVSLIIGLVGGDITTSSMCQIEIKSKLKFR